MLPSRLVKRQHATHVVEVHHRAPRTRRDAAKEQSVRRRSEAPAAQASPADEVGEHGAHHHCASELHPVRHGVAHVRVGRAVRDVHLVRVGEPGLRRGEDAADVVHVRPEQRAAPRGVGRAARAAAALVPAPEVPRYVVSTARPRLVRVRCTYRGAAAALCLRYVRYAGGWYA